MIDSIYVLYKFAPITMIKKNKSSMCIDICNFTLLPYLLVLFLDYRD